ncbi:hypothetical protein ACWDSJ_26440 [Nocardia sp. NPDC003482]
MTTDSRYVSGGPRVCPSCAERYQRCEFCGTLLPDFADCGECSLSARVRNYSYKPDPRFFGSGPVFLGWELEIIVPSERFNDAVNTASEQLGRLAYLKHDSSIQPLGFELVTHPMDYSFAMERFPWPLLAELGELGCESDARVGLHVHVSRAGFSSPAHIFRWAKFVYRNESHTVALARRRCNAYAGFSPTARARIKDSAKGDMHRFGLDRYQAINPLPRHTLEVRVFAGSLDPLHVRAALGFTAATVEYTRALRASDVLHHAGWEWPRFAVWVREHPEYAPLWAQMEDLACAC